MIYVNENLNVTVILIKYVNFNCNFSYKHYLEVLDYAKKKYSIGTLKEFHKLQKKQKFIILRHDVDFSLDYALKLANLENKHDVRSTYFVLLHSQYYNALSNHNISIINKISELGHEIGLHYDTEFMPKSSKKINEQILKEIAIISDIIGMKVVSIAQHNVTISPVLNPNKIKGFMNTQDPEISKMSVYISDSVQKWRRGCMCNHIGKENRLQVLTHPMWWTKDSKSRKNILDDFRIMEFMKIKDELKSTHDIHTTYLENLT